MERCNICGTCRHFDNSPAAFERAFTDIADRVIVLSPHPGTVKAEVKITLPRPRDALSVPFLEYQRVIVSHLGGR